MRSTREKGTYYVHKTKKWLEARGFKPVNSEIVEKLQRITIGRKVIWGKKDLFGADIVVTNKDVMLFCQSKLGKGNVSEAFKTFEKYEFPCCVKKLIFVWKKYGREPLVIQVMNAEQEERKEKVIKILGNILKRGQ